MGNMNISRDMNDALETYEHRANEIFDRFLKSLRVARSSKNYLSLHERCWVEGNIGDGSTLVDEHF